MRFPRGMYMRGMRPPYPTEEEDEEEDTEMSDDKKDDESNGGGPKSLMSIKTPKHVKEHVKTQILSHGPQIMAPLGMGMGPRYHLRGMRPPPGMPPMPPPSGPPPEAAQASSTSRGRGKSDLHSKSRGRGSLKRPAPSSSGYEGTRPNKMMAHSFSSNNHNITPSTTSSGSSSARSNLRQIQIMDEPMQVSSRPHGHPQPQQQHMSQPKSQNHGSRQSSYGGFNVSHKPTPSLTQIRTVDSGLPDVRRPPPPQNNSHSSNLRNIPTIGGSSVPTPMPQPRITKTGGSSSRILISHLPPSMSFERITAMTTACGSVKTLNKTDNNSAIVEFANPAGAENFIRSNNRKVIDHCMITVSRLA